MDIVNLVNFIQEGLFLSHEVLSYDAIVWEKMPSELNKNYNHIELADLQYDFGAAGKMAALSDKYQSILIIIDTINALYLLPWLSSLPKDKRVTVLQLNAGIASYMTKSQPDITDIAMLLPYIAVKEVFDEESLMQQLVSAESAYVRISPTETHAALFEKKIDMKDGIGDLRDRWFEGVAGTVIAPGGVLVQAIHALQHLREEGKSYDLFVLGDYNFAITKDLKESIIKTEHIIMLLDQQRRTNYEAVVKAKLWDSWLVDTEISFVYPNSEKINTILPEYLWEQANWDGLWVAEKINSIH